MQKGRKENAMDTVKYCGIALVGVFLSMLLKQIRPEYGTLCSAASCLLLAAAASSCIVPLISYLKELEGGKMSECIQLLLKALGIGMLTQTAAELCRDAGDSAIASKLELLGKAEILVLALPFISDLLSMARALLSL